MAKLDSKLKLFILIHLLISDVVFGSSQLPQRNRRPSLSSKSSARVESQEDIDRSSAYRLVLNLSASFQGQLDLQTNASCEELADGGLRGKGFSQELLGLAMVPVLVSTGCLFEAQALVIKLYAVLGQNDTCEFLQDILDLIKKGKERETAHTVHHTSSFSSPVRNSGSQSHMKAVMFNIQQLAEVGERADGYKGNSRLRRQCKEWVRVQGAQLLGQAVEQNEPMHLMEAQQTCRSLGIQCAGVTQNGDSGFYHVILRPGSRIVPSSDSESWIQLCKVKSMRWRRNGVPQHHCANEKEVQVYTVVEWIPAVSTLYNLGTAVYYASVNCYDTAKERAIFSTVDLGTDALMAVTGGTAGVAGYALGAGLKTSVKAGIKYLMNNMKEETDLIVNQDGWEDGTLTVQ